MLQERVDAHPGPRRDGEDLAGCVELGGERERPGRARAVEAIDLVDRHGDRDAGGAQRGRDEAVAGTDALLGVEHEERGVGLGELVLDAVLHPLRQRVARALDARQVDEDDLRLAVRDDAADGAPGRLRLVGDDRDLAPDHRVDERRLADVRPAGERDEAGARRSPAQDFRLEGEHLALVGLVVHPREVQRAVDDRLAQVLGARPGR